jgi:hypothetical protein
MALLLLLPRHLVLDLPSNQILLSLKAAIMAMVVGLNVPKFTTSITYPLVLGPLSPATGSEATPFYTVHLKRPGRPAVAWSELLHLFVELTRCTATCHCTQGPISKQSWLQTNL